MLSRSKAAAFRLASKTSVNPVPAIPSVGLRRYSKISPPNNQFFQISSRVRDALANGEPVVALETTIYTHGFPFPENMELAENIERLVHDHGAVPAHIGIINGRALVGMSGAEMFELLSQASQGKETIKLSRRDLGYIAGQRQLGKQVNGGTTIAGTTVLAHLAGIQVFATGGLGGVHKGGEVSMDVSADLTELGRTPIALVSSGCKSFLDIPRTLEYLETQGVGVGTFADGREGNVEFPAFWTRNSGTPSPRTIKDEIEAAAIINAQYELGLQSGLFFANPIAEEHSLAKEVMDDAMATAVRDAEDAGVTGHANTPFVLNRIREITQGRTVKANRELVFSNVVRGAKVAHHLASLQSKSSGGVTPNNLENEIPKTISSNTRSLETPFNRPDTSRLDPDPVISRSYHPQVLQDRGERPPENACHFGPQAEVLVVGSVALDIACDRTPTAEEADEWVLETSNRAAMKDSVGGVGGNIATASCYSGAKTTLLSLVGDDAAAQAIKTHFLALPNLHTHLPSHETLPTARYIALNAQQKLSVAVSDMRLFESDSRNTEECIRLYKDSPGALQPAWLVLDTNWNTATLRTWLKSGVGRKIACEPVSVSKASRIVEAVIGSSRSRVNTREIDLITPNEHELAAMANTLRKSATAEQLHLDEADIASCCANLAGSDTLADLNASLLPSKVQTILQDSVMLLHVSRCLMVTLGQHGVLMVKHIDENDPLRRSKDAERFMTPGPVSNASTPPDGSLQGQLLYVRHFPAATLQDKIVSVNGAGDTFMGVLLAGLAGPNAPAEDVLIPLAQQGAALTLNSSASVSPSVQNLSKVLRSGSG